MAHNSNRPTRKTSLEHDTWLQDWLEDEALLDPSLLISTDRDSIQSSKNQGYRWIHHILREFIKRAPSPWGEDGWQLMDLCLARALERTFPDFNSLTVQASLSRTKRMLIIFESIISRCIPESVAELLGNRDNWRSNTSMFEAFKKHAASNHTIPNGEAYGNYAILFEQNFYCGKTFIAFPVRWHQHRQVLKLTPQSMRQTRRQRRNALYSYGTQCSSNDKGLFQIFADVTKYGHHQYGRDLICTMLEATFSVLRQSYDKSTPIAQFASACRPPDAPLAFTDRALNRQWPLLEPTNISDWTDDMDNILRRINAKFSYSVSLSVARVVAALDEFDRPKSTQHVHRRRRLLGLHLDEPQSSGDKQDTPVLLDNVRENDSSRKSRAPGEVEATDGPKPSMPTITNVPRSRPRSLQTDPFIYDDSLDDSDFEELQTQNTYQDPRRRGFEQDSPSVAGSSATTKRTKRTVLDMNVVTISSDEEGMPDNAPRGPRRRQRSVLSAIVPNDVKNEGSTTAGKDAIGTQFKENIKPATHSYTDDAIRDLNLKDRANFFALRRTEIALKQESVQLELQMMRFGSGSLNVSRGTKEILKEEEQTKGKQVITID